MLLSPSTQCLALALCALSLGACSSAGSPEGVSAGSGGTAATAGGSGGNDGAGDTGTGGEAPQGPEVVNVSGFYFEGIQQPAQSGEETEFLRFEESLYSAVEWTDGFNPGRARTTAGGALIFETTSPEIQLNFRFDAAHENRNSTFGVSQNGGAFVATFVSKDEANTTLTISSSTPGEAVRYRVVLPNWSNPILTGMTLSDGHELSSFQQPVRPVYVALGDSITHGTGQPSSFEGYALQTSDALGTELFNLSVGGSKVSVPIADSLKSFPRVDLVTVLVGYNDWMNEGKTIEEYRTAYDALLGAIRQHHTEAALVCLNLITAADAASSASNLDISTFRQVISEVVTARQLAGDEQLYLAPSESWTEVSDLADAAHLSTAGAKKFADSLTDYLQQTIDLNAASPAPSPPEPSGQTWDFASDAEGFVAWENANLAPGSTSLTHSVSCDGSADGCLRVSVPLTATGQTGGIRLRYAPPEDLSGQSVTIRYKVLAGVESQITAYAQDASYKVDSVFRPFPEALPSDWRTVSFAVDTGDMLNPTEVLHLGTQILLESGASAPTTAEVLIDSISLH